MYFVSSLKAWESVDIGCCNAEQCTSSVHIFNQNLNIDSAVPLAYKQTYSLIFKNVGCIVNVAKNVAKYSRVCLTLSDIKAALTVNSTAVDPQAVSCLQMPKRGVAHITLHTNGKNN